MNDVVDIGLPSLPALSTGLAVNSCGPDVNGFSGVNVHVPSGCTVAVPINPPLSYTLTCSTSGVACPVYSGRVSSVVVPSWISPVTAPTSSNSLMSVKLPSTGAVVSIVISLLVGAVAFPA